MRRNTGPRTRSRAALLFPSLHSTDLPLQSSIALITQRLDGIAGAARSAGAIPLQKGRLTPATIGDRKFHVTINGVEQAIFAQGLGRYDDGSYRSVYLEFAFGADVTVAKTGTLTFNTTARVPADIAASVLDATWGFSDPVTHLPLGGTTATGWMKNPGNIGRNSVVVAASDPLYLAPLFNVLPRDNSGTTANSDWTAQGSEVLAPTIGTKTFAQQVTTYTSRIATYLTAGGLSMWAKGGSYGFLAGTILNASFFGSDLTNAANDPGSASTPAYYTWRYFMGTTIDSGKDFHYYDNAKLHFELYAATGSLTYYAQACAYAWCYRYKHRWDTNAGVVLPFGEGGTSIIHKSSPEGVAMHYLLTGDPESLYGIQTMASRVDYTHMATDGFYMGEPRPTGRGMTIIRCAWEASTAANETQSWQAALDAALTIVLVTGTGRYLIDGKLTYRSAVVTQYPEGVTQYCGGVGSNTFVTPFQHAVIMDALWRIYYRASTSDAQKALLRTAIQQMANALYTDYFRGDNELYQTPHTPCFLDMDSGSGASLGTQCTVSQYDYTSGGKPAPYMDSANFFPSAFAATAKMAYLDGNIAAAVQYRAMAERIFVNAVGIATDGGYGPDLEESADNSYKVIKEQYWNSLNLFYHLATGPAKGVIAGDTTVDSITMARVGSLFGAPATSLTLTGSARNNVKYPITPAPATGWSAVSTNTAVASVAVVGNVVTVTRGATNGTANITVSYGAINATVVTVTTATLQLAETWSTNSIRAGFWNDATNLTGTGARSAATGKLVLSTTSAGAGNVEVVNPGSTANRYDLTTTAALSAGFLADMQTVVAPANAFFVIQDATGVGFAFRIGGGNIEFGRLASGAGTIVSRFSGSALLAYNATTHRYLRFLYDGAGNVSLDTAPDALVWTNRQSLANSGSMSLTAVGMGFAVNSGASDNSLTVGNVTAN